VLKLLRLPERAGSTPTWTLADALSGRYARVLRWVLLTRWQRPGAPASWAHCGRWLVIGVMLASALGSPRSGRP
jgi:hypothetical protein